MNSPIDLDHIKHQLALNEWLADCKARMASRFPDAEFDLNYWRTRSLNGEGVANVRLATVAADLLARDRTFMDVVRCLAAETLFSGITSITKKIDSFRLLRFVSAHKVWEIDNLQLHDIEKRELEVARKRCTYALTCLSNLQALGKAVELLTSKGVIPVLNWRIRRETVIELNNLRATNIKQRRARKALLLDHQIESLNDAWEALVDKDSRLTHAHEEALLAMGLNMCAPSRINEPLCMSIDDFVTVGDYAVQQGDNPQQDCLYHAHQMLIVTMKGSKGASWAPKPVLNFMMNFFHYCMNRLEENGKRSRMLIEWYQKNPDTLYLPPELEHLRGKDMTIRALRQIMMLKEDVPASGDAAPIIFRKLKQHVRVVRKNAPGRGGGGEILVLPWHVLEAEMLERVHYSIDECRRVTPQNCYQGDLSKMLFLYDHAEARPACYPGFFTSHKCGSALKNWKRGPYKPRLTAFDVLGITMPVNGKIVPAFIEPHDPRRWLTTMAESYGSKLPEVLFNHWAQRKLLSTLWEYDYEPLRSKAAKSVMPDAHGLDGLSQSGLKMPAREEFVGLKRRFIEVHNVGVSVVSMEAIYNASENRPCAQTAEDMTVLYANWYGCCSHPHHSAPCAAYASCLPCDENSVVKGHIPTNDHIRERKDQLHGSILAEIRRLVEAKKYDIADDQEAADQHILALARQGLNPEQMTDYLIEEFHEHKHKISDVVFRNLLEEAFVATGYVDLLDDPSKISGANLRYNNPSRHAAPGLEIALQTHGGPQVLEKKIEDFAIKFPQFGAQSEEELHRFLLAAPDDEIDDASVDGMYEDSGDE